MGGFLIGERGSSVVEDIVLFPEQYVSQVEYFGSPHAQADLLRNISAEKKRVIGWWHSHNHMPAFHSGQDDRNFESLFNSVAPYNRIKLGETRIPVKSVEDVILEDGSHGVRIIGSAGSSDIVLSGISSGQFGQAFELEEITSGFAYSIVVSLSKGKSFYAEVLYELPYTGEPVKLRGVPLEVITSAGSSGGPCVLRDALAEEIKRKVRISEGESEYEGFKSESVPEILAENNKRAQDESSSGVEDKLKSSQSRFKENGNECVESIEGVLFSLSVPPELLYQPELRNGEQLQKYSEEKSPIDLHKSLNQSLDEGQLYLVERLLRKFGISLDNFRVSRRRFR